MPRLPCRADDRGIESPTRFVLLVVRDRLADHQAFRDSEDFPRWRAPIAEHLGGTPHVEHVVDVRSDI